MHYLYYDTLRTMSMGLISFRSRAPAGPSYRRGWVDDAIAAIEADQCRTADTHLIRLIVPALAGIDIYLKDESTHPTGSLKHRLARSLFLYALCNGHIREGTPVVEASSGSTAVSEAYFAQMIGVPFYAVMPRTTSAEKIAAIEHYGGNCHLIDDGRALYAEAAALAARLNGHYMDQFTFAERATDWRGNNNIAESIFTQLKGEPRPIPDWIVMGAGTGGTSATIGRYLRYRQYPTRLCVADVEHSAFFDCFRSQDRTHCEPSFVPGVVDRMMKIPDAATIAAMNVLSRQLRRAVGGSTGTNFLALCRLASEMRKADMTGSLVTLICDSGERYRQTYYEPAWLDARGLDPAPTEAALSSLLATGEPLTFAVEDVDNPQSVGSFEAS
jgi:cysteine synthase